MLTNNGLQWIRKMGTDIEPSNMNLITTNGNRQTYYSYGSGYIRSYMGGSTISAPPSSETGGVAYPFIGLGNGDTLESVNDYKLDSYINTLSYVTGSASQNGDLCTKTATFKNNTSSTIIVKEVGLYFGSGNSSTYPPLLLARKVLDTPISIEPGETKTFSVHIYINI